MKRQITRQSLDELQKALTALSQQEQAYYVGGGTGSEDDPYTFAEYQGLLNSGSWLGGYVMGYYEVNTRDESGNFVKSVLNESVYIAKDERLLEDVVVYGKYPRDDNNYYEISGAYPYTESDMPSGSFYGEDTNDLSGSYLAISGLGGGGGGSAGWHQNPSKQNINNSPYSDLYSASSKFRAKEAYDVLLTIQKEPVFKDLLQEINKDYKSKIIFDYKNFNSHTRRGETHYELDNTEIKIYLNEQTIDTRSKIGLAVTIVHEMLHAKLHALLRAYINNNPKCIATREVTDSNGQIVGKKHFLNLSMLPKTFSQDHKEFYEALTLSNGDIELAHHEYIYRNAAIYAADIAQIFGITNYKAVASLFYSGLKDAPSFQKLYENQRQAIDKDVKILDPKHK